MTYAAVGRLFSAQETQGRDENDVMLRVVPAKYELYLTGFPARHLLILFRSSSLTPEL